MQKIFFISDLHFDHENVIKYDKLPYSSAEEMNRSLIRKWNSVVSKNDVVWFLGDLHLGGRKCYDRIVSLVAQLNGIKHMVRGNHDRLKDIDYLQMGFKTVHARPIILKERFILSHAPLSTMNENSGFYYIFGHVHSADQIPPCSKGICVCSSLLGGYPIQVAVFDAA